jgi:hypothetical protein
MITLQLAVLLSYAYPALTARHQPKENTIQYYVLYVHDWPRNSH